MDQNFDSYSVEYTFADGTKMYMDGRCEIGCNDIYFSYAHGSKGMADRHRHRRLTGPPPFTPARSPRRDNAIWTSKVSRG